MKKLTKNKRRRFKWLIFPFAIICISGTLIWIFNKPVQIWIDKSRIKKLKEELLSDFTPGNADSLRLFLDTFDLQKNTKPIYTSNIEIRKRTSWSLQEKFDHRLIEEIAVFPSLLANLNPSDSACFYIYRKNKFKNSKIILWVPGLGVSDLAFCFIKQIFILEIERGYTVVVYIPPFHMNRKISDKENGDGFIGANIQNNLKIQLEAVRELRTMLNFLDQKSPKEISAWGGSMGASFLLLSSQFHSFEHVSLMIPVVDWEHTMLENEELKPLIQDYSAAGIDSTLLSEAFRCISPINYQISIPQERTLIQLADYDQLTSKKKVLEFAEYTGIKNILSYQRSHATILVSKKLYQDYASFLDGL